MIQFKKLIVHNFGSYGHAELTLQDRGFCLVSGQNNYSKDNAISNGSGKSFLWNAICYALTGETINGIKTNLKNINIAEPDCFVQLDFDFNKDFFTIIRTATPKTDLKIFKNNINISGKGIRESEKKLQEVLPDLTKDLIASTIIIGQGMPNRFSSFSPSGRKELLEKLTKSDFMIEDLKTRVSERSQELATKIREYENSLIANNTQLNINVGTLETLLDTINNQKKPNFDVLLEDYSAKIEKSFNMQTELTTLISKYEKEIETLSSSLFSINTEKNKINANELSAYTASKTALTNSKFECTYKISELQKQIAEIAKIVDICPTCGQKITNLKKPDDTELKVLLTKQQSNLTSVNKEIEKCEAKHLDYLVQIDEAFKAEFTDLTNKLNESKLGLDEIKSKLNQENLVLENLRTDYNKLLYDKQNWDRQITAQNQKAESLEYEIARLKNIINITSSARDDVSNRFTIIKKMDTLLKRDFRGYLLINVVNYIDAKAKDFCEIVFGTRDLSLKLDGNALDITYCNKAFDGLSGGEKQRVDLILQLSIREMLITYLDLSANILVLDEITDFLDKKSCRAVMELLETKLQSVESVFIISHHVEEFELPIDSEIKIIKNEQGISELS